MPLIPPRPEIVLGRKASDIVTNYRGIMTAIVIRLTGAIEVCLEAQADLPNTKDASRWVELSRIRVEPGPQTVALAPPLPTPGFPPNN